MVDLQATTEPPRASGAAATAAAVGLQPVGRRPALRAYLERVWASRYFLRKLSYLRYRASNTDELLGAGWNLLRPLLQAGVYTLIFGIILGVAPSAGGLGQKIVFITAGVFVFNYTSQCITGGARSVTSNLNLIRALPFPRAVLPMSAVVVDALATVPAYIALCFIGLAAHPPSIAWLALVPMLVLQTLFNVGAVFVVSRITVHLLDFAQFLPFLTRIWFYLSGVFYELNRTATIRHHPAILHLLQLNPPHVYITIARDAVIDGRFASLHWWLLGTGWAIGLCLLGFLFFWHAEETYGRD
ncbi:MAG: ABC transporter permease [Frankiaceae bacterium]